MVFVTLFEFFYKLDVLISEGVREGAKRPTAPPSLDFNYYLIIDDCFWRQLDLPPWLF